MYKGYSIQQLNRIVLLTLFCLVFFYPFGVSAAPFSLDFDGWTASDGVIDAAPCPTMIGVASCEESVEDNGFLQRIVVMDDGKRYIQRITTDPGANGDPALEAFTANSLAFAMEDFVEMNREYPDYPADVHASATTKFTVAESKVTGDIEERFVYAVRFDAGPQFDTGPLATGEVALSYGNSTTTLQEIDWGLPINPEELFYSSATIKNSPSTNPHRPEHILDQRINLGEGDSQQFKYHLLGGSQQPASRTLADPPILPGGSNGGNLNFAAGDVISATWIGQSLGNANLPNGASSEFSYTSFDKHPLDPVRGKIAISGGDTDSTSLASLTSANPSVWLIDPFGPAPAMTAADPITAVAWSAPTAIVGTAPAATPLTDTTSGGPPIAVDAWSVSNGMVTAADCPPGAECGVAITDTDFYQREVIKDGQRYFQSIITDGNATGTPGTGNENFAAMVALGGSLANPGSLTTPAKLQSGVLGFAAESFVKAGANSGVSTKQQIAEVQSNTQRLVVGVPDPETLIVNIPPELQQPGAPTTITVLYNNDLFPVVEDTLTYSTALLNTGWAQGGDASPRLELAQLTTTQIATTTAGVIADGMTTRFDLFATPSGAKDIRLSQDNQQYPTGFEQGFRMHYIDGALQNSTHLLTDPALLSGGGNIAWAPGDTIQAIWSGAVQQVASSVGMGLTAYSNLTTGESASLTRVAEHTNFVPEPPPGNLFLGTGTSSDIWTVFNANSWVAPFSQSSVRPPGINYSGNPPDWGTYGCSFVASPLIPISC